MPSKNRIKDYVNGDYYHVYNRGVERRLTFIDAADYETFIGLLQLYLLPPSELSKQHKNISGTVELAAYCLMPNHFHMLIRQIDNRGMEMLMRCVIGAYVTYFNRRYNRVGKLYQDTYKAVRILDDAQLFQTEQYIHLNPQMLVTDVHDYPYSSLWWEQPPSWLKPAPIEGRTL